MLHTKNIYGIIDSLKVSNSWKHIFKKIQVAYYHNFYQGKSNSVHTWRYGQNVMSLGAKDRFKFFTSFNFFALIFGPLYYLAKFMFIKGLILLLIEAGLIYYFDFPVAYLIILIHIYAAIFANAAYFTKMVLNNKIVKENPDILSDFVDDNFVSIVMKEESRYNLFVAFVIIASIVIGVFVHSEFTKDAKYKELINNRQRICKTSQECDKVIKDATSNIRANKEPLYVEYFNMGAAYYELKSRQSALQALDKATSLKQNYFEPYALKGVIYTDLKQFNLARMNYERALKIYPKGRFLYYLLGSSYYKEGNYVAAKANFEKAVKAYPNKSSYWEALAYTKIYLRDRAGAKNDLIKAIKVLKREDAVKNAAKIEALEGYMLNLR